MQNDFFCPTANAIATLHPFHPVPDLFPSSHRLLFCQRFSAPAPVGAEHVPPAHSTLSGWRWRWFVCSLTSPHFWLLLLFLEIEKAATSKLTVKWRLFLSPEYEFLKWKKHPAFILCATSNSYSIIQISSNYAKLPQPKNEGKEGWKAPQKSALG